jgi:hypothetical protein
VSDASLPLATPAPVPDSLPDPAPITPALLPVPDFDKAMLPATIAEWVFDIADSAQCPVDYVAASFIVGASSVIGRQIMVYPKQYDEGFRVIPNLWGCIIGPPGVMKTLALGEPLRPVRHLNAVARALHDEQMRAYRIEFGEYKLRESALKKKIAKALANDESATDLLAELANLPRPPRPIRRVYTINDVTTEKLGELLRDNPNGVLVFRDELHGLLSAMDRQGHEGERDFYNQAWNGNEPFDLARIGRGEVFIPHVCASILGGIQPEPLSQYLNEAFSGARNDGFIQRLQVLVYPRVRKAFKLVDRKRLSSVYKRVDGIVAALCNLASHGYPLDEGRPHTLHFTPEAQQFWNEWWIALEHQLRSDEDHPVIIAHMAKYRSLFPSLAVIFHLLDTVEHGRPGPISYKAAVLAAAWCAYLEAHARRVYALVTHGSASSGGVVGLSEKIKAGQVPAILTSRIIQRKNWQGLDTSEACALALEELEELGWLLPVTYKPKRGPAPGQAWKVNPKVMGKTRNLSKQNPISVSISRGANPQPSTLEEKKRSNLSIYLNSLHIDTTPTPLVRGSEVTGSSDEKSDPYREGEATGFPVVTGFDPSNGTSSAPKRREETPMERTAREVLERVEKARLNDAVQRYES